MDLKSNNKIIGECKYCKKKVYETDDYPLRLDDWDFKTNDYDDEVEINICHRKCEEKK